MTVIQISKCPAKLRGDLTKWLFEIGTGLYVGRVNARVRNALWDRVLELIGDGSAIMAFRSNNEAGVEIRTHNTVIRLKDFDGLALPFVLKPTETKASGDVDLPMPKAVAWRMPKRKHRHKNDGDSVEKYVIIDIETTGLDVQRDAIIEIGALCFDGTGIVSEHDWLVRYGGHVPEKITKLTGIDDKMLASDGIDELDALQNLADVVKGRIVLGYNVKFDLLFLNRGYLSHGLQSLTSVVSTQDILDRVKRFFTVFGNRSSCTNGRGPPVNYKLETVAVYFGIENRQEHRALADCRLSYQVWLKVNENGTLSGL